MSTTFENSMPNTGRAGSATGRPPTQRRSGSRGTKPTRPDADPAQFDLPKPSLATGIVFDVVLFFAAALSLIAVIHQAQEPDRADRGVDSAPPAVFVTQD